MDQSAGSDTIRCFGQRMLSPYHGVMHCVVTEWADAVTTDGQQWTLYVRGECLYDDPDEIRDRAISVPDVKYGTWSQSSGFCRAPIRLPTFDARVRQAGETALQAVGENAARLPFDLDDNFELWLLDAEHGLPLALLASACSADARESPPLLRWTPGRQCLAAVPEAQALATAINALAGARPRAVWFERHADGSGTPDTTDATDRGEPQTGDAPATGTRLQADHFAVLHVNPNALSAEQCDLLTAVQGWQSPLLLQLPTLSPRQRAALECAARGHALRLAEQLPLYPCVLDEQAITATLVEARLRRSQGADPEGAHGSGPGALSPYYIEIPDD